MLYIKFQYIIATIIGFAQRRRTLSEADRPFPQDQFFQITVDVRSMEVSDLNFNVTIEAPGSNVGRTANVGDVGTSNILSHDALFGILNATTGNLQDVRLLPSGSMTFISPLTLTIINDFRIEPLECFTMSIVSPDRERGRDTYECFDDDDNSDSFFCLHEICIEDDDGLFRDVCLDVLLKYVLFLYTFRTICCCIC